MNKAQSSEILIISSYPPRECGIATYTQDLVRAMEHKFRHTFKLSICALEPEIRKHRYPDEVWQVLNTSDALAYDALARAVNLNNRIKLVLVQHEFGFFNTHEAAFLHLINRISVPVIVTFHTVLPKPDPVLKLHVHHIAATAQAITVMTQSASHILQRDYGVAPHKITVIAHGTHLVQYMDKELLKHAHGFTGRKVLSTFGLISSGKSIETTLDALPAIISEHPDVLFLVIGKTHPEVVKHEGEAYRQSLEMKVAGLGIGDSVKFINYYLPLPHLLEYLQLTDVYLFTSKDPAQAVSGTFSYAISCGCPVISTPIPHAVEVLQNDAGILIDFNNVHQLSEAANRLLGDKHLRRNVRLNGLHKIVSTAWENVAIAHAMIFERISETELNFQYRLPAMNLTHIRNMTTETGIIQFSGINHPDPGSGYTLDDNARAMIAVCMHYEATSDADSLKNITTYLHFIQHCMQENGRFLNYMNDEGSFTDQNQETNLDDANGRAIWALGYLINQKDRLPGKLILQAEVLMEDALKHVEHMHSTRAIAFTLKGLFYYYQVHPDETIVHLTERMANQLEQMYAHESDSDWCWFESYLTYGNSVLPEGMLCAYQITGKNSYRSIAKTSFDFLLSNTFVDAGMKLISNRGWLQKGQKVSGFGEQPIDAAYTVLALSRFYEEFGESHYRDKMKLAFNWFLGHNHLNQIIYNPCTGGCYDGLEETHVNLNQGAESTVSYLMARLTVEQHEQNHPNKNHQSLTHSQLQA